MIVCRVTPANSANACCVISSWSNRNFRIRFVITPMVSCGIGTPYSIHKQSRDRRDADDHHPAVPDTQQHHANGDQTVPAVVCGEYHTTGDEDQPEDRETDQSRSDTDKLVALVFDDSTPPT